MVSGPDPDEEMLQTLGRRLADGIEESLPGWVERQVGAVLAARGRPLDDGVRAAAAAAGAQARADVGPAVRALLEADLDGQTTTPLALVRTAVRYPTAVLRGAGVPPASRDRFAERAFPEDVYDLSPATFADLSPDLADVGLAWGAAKAFLHRRRHAAG